MYYDNQMLNYSIKPFISLTLSFDNRIIINFTPPLDQQLLHT
jgi:hypothetical protein